MAETRWDWQDGQLKVVVNLEEQYSIWPVDKAPPSGWREVGRTSTRDECLKYIAEAWEDLRPLSVRRIMDAVRETPLEGCPGRVLDRGAEDRP